MNARHPIACFLAAVALPIGAAAQGFEGVVEQRITTVSPSGVAALAGADTAGGDRAKVLGAVAAKIDGADASLVQTQALTVYAKGSKLRVDGGAGFGPGGFVVMDARTDSIFFVMPSMRRVMVMTLADVGQFAKQASALVGAEMAAAGPTRIVADLGDSTVGGVRLHGYRVTNDAMLTEHWLDPSQAEPDMPEWQGAMSRVVALPVDTTVGALLRGKGRVVRVISIRRAPVLLGGGWVVSRMDSSPPEKRAVNDTIFAVPADLPRVRISDMFPR